LCISCLNKRLYSIKIHGTTVKIIYYFIDMHNLRCSLHGVISELPQEPCIGVYYLAFHLGAANECFTPLQLEMYKSYAKLVKSF